MRTILSRIVFGCLLIGALAQGSSCPDSLARLNSQNTFGGLSVILSSARRGVKERLESVPPELLSPRAPTFQELEKIDVSSWKIPKQLDTKAPLAQPQALEPVLKLFQQLKTDADYLFVGNGFYLPYLMARSAFEGTPMAERIKFVAFSRELAKKANDRPEDFNSYFKTLDLPSPEAKRKIVVIDSISSLDSNHDHSIIRTSNALRKFLIQQRWSHKKAVESVITLGMPEGEPSHSYRSFSLEDYEKKLSQVSPEKINSDLIPYLDPGIVFDQSPFLDSYSYTGDGIYWNGKYQSLDKMGMPKGIEDIRMGLDRIPLRELDEVLADRAKKTSFYQEIIQASKKNASRYQKEINEIIQQHKLK